jgi:pilus assembly protein CpaD
MKMHQRLLTAALFLGLAGCAAQYTDSEFPKQVRLDDAGARVDVGFAPGSSRLFARDVARLRALAATGAIAPSDRVVVLAGGPPGLAAARFETIAAALLPYNVVAVQGPLAPLAPNRAIVESQRYLVTLPQCPNWSKYPPLGYTNTHASNFGCTTAVDLALMVANPADLAEGRPLGPADANPAVSAVQRYQTDKVQLPSAASLSGFAASTAGPTGAGATGAGTAGTGP